MTRAKLLLAVGLLLVGLTTAAQAQVCSGDGECDDGNFCNGMETCVNLECEDGAPPEEGASCDDEVFCNGMDICAVGVCTPSGINPCSDGGECDDDCSEAGGGTCADPVGTACSSDGNPCTDDECDGAGSCGINNTASCNDGEFCNGMDTCAGGVCTPSGIDPCAGGGECDDACVETGGGGGTCTDPAGASCSSDGNACTDDVCDGAGNCGVNNTAPCNDGEFCNGMDTCSGGVCTPSGNNPCAGGGECNDECSEAGGGTCAVATGTACTGDGELCTTDECNGLGACAHVPRTGAACDDGDFCNGMDTCSAAGTCGTHGGNPCAGRPACQNVCDPVAENCLAAAGSACPDESPENECTLDRCNASGVCEHVAQPGAACNDGQFCTATDTCNGMGVCGGTGDPCASGVECAATCNENANNCFAPSTIPCTDDGNVCTTDLCNGMGACGHPPNTAPCDDGLFCNGGDVCSGGACIHAGDPCTAGAECANTCNENTDDCITPADTPCKDDDLACTTDLCQGGVCAHAPADALCDQGECVLGVCTPGAPGADKRGCVATPVAEGDQCTDDGFSCTDDTCSAGACLHVPIASRCVPATECTSAVCEPGQPTADAGGCIPGPVLEEGQECAEDGEPCTNDLCRTGLCAHDAVPDTITCEPVTRAFRQALALEGLARRLMATVGDAFAPNTSGPAVVTQGNMVAHLTPVTESLEHVSRVLSGKEPVPPDDGGRIRGVPKTSAQLRAESAIDQLRKKPGEVRGFLRLAGAAKRKRQVPRESARTLRAEGRLVLERMRKLGKELRRLRRVSQTFVP